jgi:transcriptional regulator with XRE-family HTH domain
MTAVPAQDEDTDLAAARPASGIVIDPERLERMRDLVPLSRDGLARRTGEILFDRERFSWVLRGAAMADARTVRALWLTLGCLPDAVIRGLPPGLREADVPKWLRRNPGTWSLDLAEIARRRDQRDWTEDDLALAVSRHWFSRDSVNKIERGERRPKGETLDAFCQILSCKPADLMKEASDQLPEGATAEHRSTLGQNKAMRNWADAQVPPVPYRNPGNGRIRYTVLRRAYHQWLAMQDPDSPARREGMGLLPLEQEAVDEQAPTQAS